ncbi:MAG: kinase/pyrophosphorylase [Bdellovibrionales bacterium]|nr:kinase/pyrophosphorylase [Bdellovibrionales bacterium]
MSQFSEAPSEPNVFLLSDGTGETGELMVRAGLSQFVGHEVGVSRYKSLKTRDQIEAILEEAQRRGAAVAYTLVNRELRAAVQEKSTELKLKHVDLLGPLMDLLRSYLGEETLTQPGIYHAVNENYFRRIEAMEFTMKQDDGAYPENLERADVILVGVSRTSKTPLSMYLSYRGWRVANVPLVLGIEPPPSLFQVDQRKIIALSIDPEALSRIRRERLVRMGRDPVGDYASLNRIREEIEWAKQLFERNRRWPVFDVTNKALEETAADIERTLLAKQPRKN